MIKACFDFTDNEIFLRSTTINDPIINLSTFAARELSDYLMFCVETNGCPCSRISVDGTRIESERKTNVIVTRVKTGEQLIIALWQWRNLATDLNNVLLIQR